jgi:hypothetical protein
VEIAAGPSQTFRIRREPHEQNALIVLCEIPNFAHDVAGDFVERLAEQLAAGVSEAAPEIRLLVGPSQFSDAIADGNQQVAGIDRELAADITGHLRLDHADWAARFPEFHVAFRANA